MLGKTTLTNTIVHNVISFFQSHNIYSHHFHYIVSPQLNRSIQISFYDSQTQICPCGSYMRMIQLGLIGRSGTSVNYLLSTYSIFLLLSFCLSLSQFIFSSSQFILVNGRWSQFMGGGLSSSTILYPSLCWNDAETAQRASDRYKDHLVMGR